MASPRAEGPDDAAAPRQPLRFPSLRFEEPFQGSSMIEELPMRVAVLLWEVHQELHRWALATRAARAKTLRVGAGAKRRQEIAALGRVDPLLREGLEVAATVLEDPAGADPVRVSRACEWIAAWAEERKAPFTRFWFTMHAAACAQFDATLYYRAACIARDAAWWDAAEVNFQCAIGVAKKCRNRQAQVTATLGLGNMYMRQGDYSSAQVHQQSALRLARHCNLPELEGRALHDLFVVLAQLKEYRKAEEAALHSLRAYGPGHHLLAMLAHDVAHSWIERGQHVLAIPVMQALLPSLEDKVDGVLCLANIARAAGGVGNPGLYQQMWTRVWWAVDRPSAKPLLAPSLLALAYGAAALEDWACLAKAAGAALEVAERRGEVDVQSEAAALLALLASRSTESARASTERASEERSDLSGRLCRELVSSLGGTENLAE